MGVYNSDWLLNQIRGTANVVSKAFKFETLDIDLGQVEDEQGHTIDGNDYIDDLLIHEQYDQATTFIHSQLKTFEQLMTIISLSASILSIWRIYHL